MPRSVLQVVSCSFFVIVFGSLKRRRLGDLDVQLDVDRIEPSVLRPIRLGLDEWQTQREDQEHVPLL